MFIPKCHTTYNHPEKPLKIITVIFLPDEDIVFGFIGPLTQWSHRCPIFVTKYVKCNCTCNITILKF
jgi:hypothetical protein